jgi:outer membrane protein assembly factor BamB
MFRRTSLLSLFALLAACPIAAADPGNWSPWRGDNRDGQLSPNSLPEKLQGKLDLVWEKPHDPSYSGPVVFDGLLFTTETVQKKYEKVTAYNLSDGSVAWTAQWEGAMAVPFFAASNGSWIGCDPPGTLVMPRFDVVHCGFAYKVVFDGQPTHQGERRTSQSMFH